MSRMYANTLIRTKRELASGVITRTHCLFRQDKDGKLSRAEFSTFLHPEEAEHMRNVVVTETIEDIDTDGDGKISVDEYIGE